MNRIENIPVYTREAPNKHNKRLRINNVPEHFLELLTVLHENDWTFGTLSALTRLNIHENTMEKLLKSYQERKEIL